MVLYRAGLPVGERQWSRLMSRFTHEPFFAPFLPSLALAYILMSP